MYKWFRCLQNLLLTTPDKGTVKQLVANIKKNLKKIKFYLTYCKGSNCAIPTTINLNLRG